MQAAFLGPAIFGLVFGLAAIISRGIAMATGIHYAVNLTTTAIGNSNNNVSIWLLKNPNSTAPNQNISILLSMAVLVFAIISMEYYIRRKTSAN